MRQAFLYSFLSHTDFFFSKILIFFVISTDFVLDQSGRSECPLTPLAKDTRFAMPGCWAYLLGSLCVPGKGNLIWNYFFFCWLIVEIVIVIF